MLAGMKRALLLLGLSCHVATAQPADCDPIAPEQPTPLQVWIGLDGRPGLPAGRHGAVAFGLTTRDLAATSCATRTAPPDDVLHGAPAPNGLLRGDGPRDVLHNAPAGRVTVEPVPPR
jgi:hypothetical protein